MVFSIVMEKSSERVPPAVRVIVRGRVQGVAFRYATQAKANEFGVDGTVRNLPDGTVEVVARGEAGRLEPFLAWLDHGPSAARVTGKTVTELASAPDGDGFQIVR